MAQRRSRSVLLAVSTLCWLGAAHAAMPVIVPPAQADTMEQATIVGVTPYANSMLPAGDVAAAAQTASAEQIERSHAADLSAFLVRRMGGVYVNEMQRNPLQPDVSYPGFTASPLLGTPQGLSVYVDGPRLNQPFGDVVSRDLIPRAAIRRIELVSGSSPLLGVNNLGGSLAVLTKDGYTPAGSGAELA